MHVKMVATAGISGLGTDVYKLVNAKTGEVLGYVGDQDGREVVHFIKPIPIMQLAGLVSNITGQVVYTKPS